MNTEKLTTKSRDAVTAAVRQALTAGNPSAEPVHLLHGLLLTPDNTVGHLLTAVGADPAAVDARATEDISKQPSSTGSSVTQPTISVPWRASWPRPRHWPNSSGTSSSPPNTC